MDFYDPLETKRVLAGYTFKNIYRPVMFVYILSMMNQY